VVVSVVPRGLQALAVLLVQQVVAPPAPLR
jgi:hypothetical protein